MVMQGYSALVDSDTHDLRTALVVGLKPRPKGGTKAKGKGGRRR
jgi:hypothetical protein